MGPVWVNISQGQMDSRAPKNGLAIRKTVSSMRKPVTARAGEVLPISGALRDDRVVLMGARIEPQDERPDRHVNRRS